MHPYTIEILKVSAYLEVKDFLKFQIVNAKCFLDVLEWFF